MKSVALRFHRHRQACLRAIQSSRNVSDRPSEVFWKRASSLSPDEILSAFCGYHPRIAVTVDMIATGTDITASRGSAISKRGAISQSPVASRDNPLEIVFFMRSVASKNFFEQINSRGVRVVSANLQRATRLRQPILQKAFIGNLLGARGNSDAE